MDQVKGLLIGTSKLNSVAANIAAIKIRSGWFIILAFVVQRMSFILSPPSFLVDFKKALLVLSYVLLLGALSRNLHLWSMRILALGAALNFAAIVPNGGLMPVSLEARLQAGMTAIRQSRFGKVLLEGTGILLPVDQTKLWFLSDISPILSVGGVFSAGDVLIGVGQLVFVLDATGGRDSRWAWEGR